MKTFKFLIILFLITIIGETASASWSWSWTSFRRPVDNLLSPPFSAYYDNDSSGWIKDYKCGTETYNKHSGTDFRGGVNTPVYAGEYGGVYAIYNKCETYGFLGSKCGGGFGNHAKIDHEGNLFDGQGLRTIYAHFKKGGVTIGTGQTTWCGGSLGLSGSSGNSTGPHVHFEVQNSSGSTDPFAGMCGGPYSYWKKTTIQNNTIVPTNSCWVWF